MKAIIFLLCLSTFLLATQGLAEGKKKGLNANIYDSTDSKNTISAKVKSFRNSRGDTLVYFEEIKKSGPYTLSSTIKDYVKMKNRIARSGEADGSKVTVTINDQDEILSVEAYEPPVKKGADEEE